MSIINGDQRLGGEDHMRFVGADASRSSFACLAWRADWSCAEVEGS